MFHCLRWLDGCHSFLFRAKMRSHAAEALLGQAQEHQVFFSLLALAIFAVFAVSPGKDVGMAKIRYWHSAKSLVLKYKDGRTTSLANLCMSLIPPCRLNPFLFNGHLQTIWTVMTRQSVPIYYKRWIFQNKDPTYTGQFAVDFATTPNDDHDPTLPPRTTYYTDQEFNQLGSLDTRPMLVLLHGLSGGSHELYLRHVLAPLLGDGGWEACVVISRGCAMTQVTTSVLYNARATWDVRETVKWLRKTFPNRPLFGIGFSLGANILTNVSMNRWSSLCANSYSISAKKAATVCSKQPLYCLIRGTCTLAVSPCRERGSIEMHIRRRWARA